MTGRVSPRSVEMRLQVDSDIVLSMHQVLETAHALQPTVTSFQDETERERRIPPILVQQLRSAGFYSLVVPRELGGLEVDLVTFLRVAELMAEADGSVGWNLANSAIQQLIALSLPQAGVNEIYKDGPDTIIDTWDMTGMRGTGSHDWSVTDQFIPVHLTVEVPGRLTFNQWSSFSRATLYALPVHAFIGPHHSVVATGIARAAIDALTELAGAKVPRGRTGLLRDQLHIQDAVARAEGILGAAQAYRRSVLSDIWATCAAGEQSTLEQRARCRLAASFAVDRARQAMDLMYRAGGTTSIERGQRLARCWRDVHVVGQTFQVLPEYYMVGGRVFLGLDPGPRLA